MPATTAGLRVSRGFVLPGNGTARFADRLGERHQVIGAGGRAGELTLVPDQVPAAGGGQTARVQLTQVVRVWLGETGQRADHRG